jgi:hypothetical protein
MLSGFDYIRQACRYILQNTGKSLVAEQALSELESAMRQFDDDLESLLPAVYANQCSNVAARAALQSLQSSLRPVSVLRRTLTAFVYLRNVITHLAQVVLQHDQALLDQFDSKIAQLEDALNALDLRMLDVFPQNAPYLTSLFMLRPPSALQPALDDTVMPLFLVRRVL